MVTFAIPGDDVADDSKATPRARPGFGFSQRGVSSPFNSLKGRAPTPHTRKTMLQPNGTPNRLSYNGQSNIFKSSLLDDPPSSSTFSPSLSTSAMKKSFAPAPGTPGSARVSRDKIAHATPRGMASKVMEKELFPMRISEPPAELTGAVLNQKITSETNTGKGSIYADQFLAHLCPPELDEEQRRQYFCILDLRRLKYSADEVFLRKGWNIDLKSFTYEFEKTRSIIMLHYGLYEFKNVKPSYEVQKRWNREHGLPDPEEEPSQTGATPSRSSQGKKKRKASDDGPSEASLDRAKRPNFGETPKETAPVAAPSSAFSQKKRKASVSEDVTESQPSKKPTGAKPSNARSLFEAAAEKASASPSPAPSQSSLFSIKPSSSNNLRQSVLTANTEAAQATSASNPFARLSDNSSAQNSGADADGESETDSASDEEDADEQDEEPARKRPAPSKPVETGTSSDAGTRESTPARSLFDRVNKDSEGQPVRAATPVDTPAAPKDQTWNMEKTPIKFAPSAPTTQASSLFGAAKPASSIFAPKSTAPSNIFGAPAQQDKPAEKEPSPEKTAEPATQDGGESDKENDSQISKKPATESKAPAQTAFASLFPKTSETSAPSPLFAKNASTGASNMFGSVGKPAEPATPALQPPSALQSSTLFGAKPAEPVKEPEKSATTEPSKPLSAFGANGSSNTNKEGASSLFGQKTEQKPTGSLFGAAKPASSLFGNNATPSGASTPGGAPATPTPATSAPGAPSSLFSFGNNSAGSKPLNGTAESASKPLFGAPKSPPATGTSLTDGSPMKQDDKSPAKPLFSLGGQTATGSSTPSFNFGGSSTPAAPTNLFGNASKPAETSSGTGAFSFGGTSAAAPQQQTQSSGGFNFNFGGGSAAPSTDKPFNNPFAAGNQAPAPSNTTNGASGGMFNFGASAAPSTGTSSPFQFGGGSGQTNGSVSFGAGSTTPGGSNMFGSGAPQTQSTPSFSFGGNQAGNAAPSFLGAPPGGPSTGTNTPFTLGGGSSLATTPAQGTPEPTSNTSGAAASKTGEEDGEEKHEQVDLTKGQEEGEETLHEVRAKVLKFVPKDDEGEVKKNPWATQGVGTLRLLKNTESGVVRLLLRAEPRGHVALNRALLPGVECKPDGKYVKVMTGGESGELETWMLQVKEKDLASKLAAAMEEHKGANKK